MTPQELKNSILQLAIQGKLVEQRPEEGTPRSFMTRYRPRNSALLKKANSKKKSPCPKSLKTKSPLKFPRVGCG